MSNSPAGVWVDPPVRYFGNEFNRIYEEWVRRITGGAPGKEYLVESGSSKVHFDTCYVDERNGQTVEAVYREMLTEPTGTGLRHG